MPLCVKMEKNQSGLTPQQIRQYNSETLRLLSLYLNLAADTVTPEIVTGIAAETGVSREYAYASVLAAVCGLETAGCDRAYFENYFLPMIKEEEISAYESDAYFRKIVFPQKVRGRWEWRTMHLPACEAFVRRDFRVFPDGRMIPQLGYFMREYTYPAVLENGREWMTLMPNETATTLPAVKKAAGRVLTFGLGLGYFAFHASEKPDVSGVTVVELSAEAASLFCEEILPQFPHREKVRVVTADAFDFLDRTMREDEYDFVFADIWHDVKDGRELVRRFRTRETRFPHTRFSYWLEDTIRCYENAALWP